MRIWLTVKGKEIVVEGRVAYVPDWPNFYEVKRPPNADGTFDVLVDVLEKK